MFIIDRPGLQVRSSVREIRASGYSDRAKPLFVGGVAIVAISGERILSRGGRVARNLLERVREVLIGRIRVLVIVLEKLCCINLRISRNCVCHGGAKGQVEEKGAVFDWNNAVRLCNRNRGDIEGLTRLRGEVSEIIPHRASTTHHPTPWICGVDSQYSVIR